MTQETFLIRKAVKEDCPQMLELVQELALYEKAPEEVTVSLSHFQESGFGKNPVWWGFVAENIDKQIVAMAIYYIRYSTWKGQTMYLEDIVVTEKYRRFGIGQQLLDVLKLEAKERNLPFIQWQVLEWNEPAILFYRKNKAELDAEWINCKVKVEC
ncbi:MAG: GNAT family N-acetyltransferase [Pseudopedobacter saltans]|uniref:GNAT family N-acetyltransferase n=1 Tax=Pseudopedobacter saltans TaxID=151895 RepID=A0A2W5FEV9_9SPHI|nr:MAG: GNAT family N-acetyltransferase [Pseudopedobacter saltans]